MPRRWRAAARRNGTGAVREPDLAGLGIDRRCAGAELQLDPVLAIEFGRTQRYPFLGCGAGEIVLGEIGPVVRPRLVRAQHRDRAGVALAPQHLGRRVSRGTAADDDDQFRLRTRGRPRRPPCRFQLFADINHAVPLLDPPARDGVECGRPQGLAGAQGEAGVVPRAANGIGDEHPLDERTVVMAALRADREERSTVACQHHRLARDLAQDHAAVGEFGTRDPLGKVGSVELLFLSTHRCLLMPAKPRHPLNTLKPNAS